MIFQAHGECGGSGRLNSERRHRVKTEAVLGESFCELDAGGRDGFPRWRCLLASRPTWEHFSADCAATRLIVPLVTAVLTLNPSAYLCIEADAIYLTATNREGTPWVSLRRLP